MLGMVDQEAQQRQQHDAVEDEGEGLESRAEQLHWQRWTLVRARHAHEHAAREDEHGADKVVGGESLVWQQNGSEERVPADGEPRHRGQQRLRGEAVGQRAQRRVHHQHGEEAAVEVGAAQIGLDGHRRHGAVCPARRRGLLLLALVVRQLEQQLAGDAEDAGDGGEKQPKRPADEPHGAGVADAARGEVKMRPIKEENLDDPILRNVAPNNLQIFLAKTEGDAWLSSLTEDVNKLQKGEKTALIEALTQEDKELQGESGLEKVLAEMPSPSTDEIHVLVVVPPDVGSKRPADNKVAVQKRLRLINPTWQPSSPTWQP
ncbi:unnamed protein product [Phytophthora lilii]|uniref:Unnamed protein product n=1 Tax=Phytophthora lilii TaxID=2077276 RepID=A0A9W6X9M1_9STRA|nr:unnamed protein product [Phytophthora lilii]